MDGNALIFAWGVPGRMLARLPACVLALVAVVPMGLVSADHVLPTCYVPTAIPLSPDNLPPVPPPNGRAYTVDVQGTYYLRVRDMGGSVIVQIWQESNHVAGLQYLNWTCSGTLYPRDTIVGCPLDSARPLQCV